MPAPYHHAADCPCRLCLLDPERAGGDDRAPVARDEEETMSLLRLPDRTLNVLEEVGDERARQNRKWGEQNHDPTVWLAVAMEELGEAAQAVLKVRGEGSTRDPRDYRAEMLQVAAVAVAAVEAFDRGGVNVPRPLAP